MLLILTQECEESDRDIRVGAASCYVFTSHVVYLSRCCGLAAGPNTRFTVPRLAQMGKRSQQPVKNRSETSALGILSPSKPGLWGLSYSTRRKVLSPDSCGKDVLRFESHVSLSSLHTINSYSCISPVPRVRVLYFGALLFMSSPVIRS